MTCAEPRADLDKVAADNRFLLKAFGVAVIANIMVVMGVPASVRVPVGLGMIVLGVLLLIAVFRLSRNFNRGALPYLHAVLAAIPLISLVVMLLLSNKAVRMLKGAGRKGVLLGWRTRFGTGLLAPTSAGSPGSIGQLLRQRRGKAGRHDGPVQPCRELGRLLPEEPAPRRRHGFE